MLRTPRRVGGVLLLLRVPGRGRARPPRPAGSVYLLWVWNEPDKRALGDQRTKAVKGTQNILINEKRTSRLCLVNPKSFCTETKTLLLSSDSFKRTQGCSVIIQKQSTQAATVLNFLSSEGSCKYKRFKHTGDAATHPFPTFWTSPSISFKKNQNEELGG